MFKSLERALNEKIHNNLFKLLAETGYDTKTALKSINLESIDTIERYVNANRERFCNILKGTPYENNDSFKFLPGHTAFLLSLPKYISSPNTKKYKLSENNQCNEVMDHTQSAHESVNESNSDKIDDTANVRQELVNKINNFSRSKHINVQISDDNIQNFRVEKKIVKCSVKCPACGKKIPCSYVSHWTCGNVQTHLKSHITSEEYEVNENGELNLISDDNNSLDNPIRNIKKLKKNRIDEIQLILK